MKTYKRDNLAEIITDLNNNEVVAFPTETVFGLGIKATSKENYLKMVEVKKRPPEKPFTLMCSSVKMAQNFVKINEITKKVMENFMPGPITLILEKKENVPSFIDLDSGYVGVRIPNEKTILKIIEEVGSPLLVPSANISGQVPINDQKEIIKTFEGKIAGVLDGHCGSAKPSTIIKINKEQIELIRSGDIALETILEKLK